MLSRIARLYELYKSEIAAVINLCFSDGDVDGDRSVVATEQAMAVPTEWVRMP